jgi:predicted permease
MAIFPLAMGATAVLLLLACANAANLLLARIARRQRALALRSALGAGRGRLLRGILVEAAVLAAASAVVGLGVAAMLASTLSGVRPFRAGPTLIDVPIDWHVAGFASAIAAVTLLMFSAVPALAGSNVDVRGLLQQSGRTTSGRRRTQHTLVVLQLALALVLVASAGVLARSVAHLRALDLGMQPDQVVEFSIDALDGGAELKNPDAYIRRVLAQVERTGGVRAVGIAAPPAFAPFSPRVFMARVRAAGAVDRSYLEVVRRHVSGGYFAALGIPLLAGRTFTPDEYTSTARKNSSAGVVVSAKLARLVFGGADVVGRHLSVTTIYDDPERHAHDAEIVGVVGDTRSGWDYLHDGAPAIYEADRTTYAVNTFYVRSELAPAAILGSLRDTMRDIEPRLPLRDVMTLRQEFDALFPEDRTIADLMRLVAGLALTLGLFGVASVMACTLVERTREFGVRVALGASPGRLTRDVLRPVLVTGLTGAGIGLALFASLSGVLSSYVHGVGVLDPFTLGAATSLLLAAVLAAAWLPTRRLARTDPTVALRAE